jgi:hypothetical protein
MEENLLIYYTNLVFHIASLISCLFIIITISVIRELWNFHFRLIFYLSISNIFMVISSLIPQTSNESFWCQFQGFLNSFAGMSRLLFTAFMMFSLYRIIVHNDEGNRWIEILYLLIAWPGMIAISLISLSSYQPQPNGQCWLNPDDYFLIILKFIGPIFLVMIVNTILCILILSYLKNSTEDSEVLDAKKVTFRQFAYYPIALFLCYLPMVGRRILLTCFVIEIDWLSFVALVSRSGFSVYCAIIFGSTRYIRSRIFPCYRRRSQSEDHSINSGYARLKD